MLSASIIEVPSLVELKNIFQEYFKNAKFKFEVSALNDFETE